MKRYINFYKLLKRVSIGEIEKAYILFRYKYPKLIMLLLSIFTAYYLFSSQFITSKIQLLQSFSYLGIFFAGILFSFGFSAPFALGLFITLQPQNIFLASIIGAVGSVISDLVIFKFIQFSFADEFKRLNNEKPIKEISFMIKNNLGLKASTYLFYLFAGILLASPLPDEVGVAMLAGLTTIKPSFLGIISFITHAIGIFILLLLF